MKTTKVLFIFWMFSCFLMIQKSSLALTSTPMDKAVHPSRYATQGILFDFYGFLQASWLGATHGIDSFSQPNMSAYTAAGNPVTNPNYNQAQAAFNVAQSRFGFLTRPSEHVLGRLEFDFISPTFTQASPTTQAMPRLRIVAIDYQMNDALTLRFGQHWDVVSPLGPFTYNWVGHYFESGDLGFMRIQATAFWKRENFEHTVSVGMPTANATATNNYINFSIIPTLTIRESLTYSDVNLIGISAIGAILKNSVNSKTQYFAGVFTAFWEHHFPNQFQIRSEGYFGRDTYNLGLFGLGYSNGVGTQPNEAGGYISARKAINETLAIFGGLGGAWILNPEGMAASYTTNYMIASPSTGPGMEYNLTARAGIENQLTKSLVVFGELAYLNSYYHFTASTPAVDDPNSKAGLVQTGVKLDF